MKVLHADSAIPCVDNLDKDALLEIIGEAYQFVGGLADEFGVFEREDVVVVLDRLAYGRVINE